MTTLPSLHAQSPGIRAEIAATGLAFLVVLGVTVGVVSRSDSSPVLTLDLAPKPDFVAALNTLSLPCGPNAPKSSAARHRLAAIDPPRAQH